MKLKIYERTGIKEEQLRKRKLRENLKLERHKQKIKKAIARGLNKKSKENCYDVEKMNYEKEYKKTENLLNGYKERIKFYSDNIQVLIRGYLAYFEQCGTNLTPLRLRIFRKNVKSTIDKAYQIEREREKEKQENELINLCIQYLEEMKDFLEEMKNLQIEEYTFIENDIAYMVRQLNVEDNSDFERLKVKMKSIYETLK